MRATITRSDLNVLRALGIEEIATYHVEVSLTTPEGTDVVAEDVLPGTTVRALIRAQTRFAPAITQVGKSEVTVSWTNLGGTRTKTCTYSKVC